MMGCTLSVDAFGNPDELSRMKTRREQLQMELLRINIGIQRIEAEQYRAQQVLRNAWLHGHQWDCRAQSLFLHT